ncbi:hypothetical protein QR98_0049560 [Sarcoptes scabiei]|uniref:Uncharacterized protein n=1 Tax=Sarcoptes scabiei TaxID=52283 RepID=A0A132A6G1_SARSC|nr:hypothetical protein QR98_0049560 [Sarcoptes scabiei]
MLEENIDVEAIKSCKTLKKKRKINKSNKKAEGNKAKFETKHKFTLIRKGNDLFEILPEGWVEIIHFSGIPIYLDKKTRVCTTTKPYHLGIGSARKHKIPLSSIPCFQYQKELSKEKELLEQQQRQWQGQQKEENPGKEISSINENPSKEMPNVTAIAKVETLAENKKEKSLNHLQIVSIRNNSCKKIHVSSLKNCICLCVIPFCKDVLRTVISKNHCFSSCSNWAERRKHEQWKKRTVVAAAQRSTLPESTKLITCTIPNKLNSLSSISPIKSFRKEFIMNPAGKSYVCILHEYVQHTEKTQPKYIFEELGCFTFIRCSKLILSNSCMLRKC